VPLIREDRVGGRSSDESSGDRETESCVRVLEVKFADSGRAVIPRANVELIEG
jgi:hypothetical protein